MNILIIGGAGLIGQKLARALIRRGHLDGQEIDGITLADTSFAPAIDGTSTTLCDISDPKSVERVVTAEYRTVFLLAAVVSAQAEEEFDTGMRINLFGALNVLERLRHLGTAPRVVFTSSLAVYGGEVPDPVTDTTLLNPQTSYGTQKAVIEMLVNDYSRKGFLDGRAFRLPTISVRPGKPNRAASSFMSAIIREPLTGHEAVCPVAPDYRHYYLSPRRCVENLILGAEVAAERLGSNRAVMMPGRTASIADLIAALDAVAGPVPATRIRFEPDARIARIVSGWRYDYRPDKALALGMRADESFRDNIRYFLEDDCPTPVLD